MLHRRQRCRPMEAVVMKRIGIVAVAFALLAGAGTSCSSKSEQGSQSHRSLTERGQLLWNLEGLLRKSFRDTNDIWMSSRTRPTMNFMCCSSHAQALDYTFVFQPPGGSMFHLSSRHFPPGDFGNFPAQVLVHGRSVACDAQETRFLIAHRDAASLALDCSPPPG